MARKTLAARQVMDLGWIAAFDKKKDAEEETITVALPDDLSTLSDDDLESLRQSAIEAFNALYQGGSVRLTADQEVVLGQLKDAKVVLDTEKRERAVEAAARAERAAEFAAAMVDAEDEAEVEEPEAVVAAAQTPAEMAAVMNNDPAPVATPRGPISVPRVKARQTAQVQVTEPAPVSPFMAATNVPGLVAGAHIGVDEIADAYADMMDSASTGAIRQAQATGIAFSQKHPVAHIAKPFAPEAIVSESNDASAAIKFVTNQNNLKGGSLVAAGGWCAPSETLYDLCQLESADGILSVPEIQVNRGGIRFTQGPDWADIYASTGFCFDEADDIAGTYTTNENQSITEGGAGLTSFTLTFSGSTTGSIPAATTAAFIQQSLEALPTVGPGNVSVTGSGANGPWTAQFVNGLGGTNVATMTATPTGGTGTVTIAVVNEGGGTAGTKPNNIVPCPSFTDVRLGVCGVQIQAGNLLNRAYPELVRRYVSGALTAHMHRVATNVLLGMIAQSTAVTPTTLTNGTGVTSPVLSAIELQAEDMRYRRRMSRGSVLEAIFPFWARGAIRADLSRRMGVELLNVSDAMIEGWFRARGINPQFIYNFDNLGAAGAALAWPTSLRFLLYPAGTWVRGSTALITLSMLHDSTLNANNNFTAIFTEEGWSVMKLCHDSRVITVPICANGNTHSGSVIAC